ncbi:MAG: hypothetical protein JWO30_1830 [Fibrobacteres bacterium]|nr:hypothetical protein [Fibrobacterota bacterium]
MKKVLALHSVALMVALLTGCNETTSPTDPAGNSVSFSNLAVSPDSIYTVSSAFGRINGTLTGTSTITAYTFTVHGKNGVDASSMFEIDDSVVQKKVVDLNADANARIRGLFGVTRGKYYLILKATSDGKVSTDSVAFTVIQPTDLVTTTLVAGSNQSVEGSSIDLDEPAIYTAATSAANLTAIDLCYAHSTGANGIPAGDYLFSPDKAKSTGNNFTSGWTGTANATAFYKLQNFPGFDTVYTKADVAALWTEPTEPTPDALVASGDVFIAKTEQGAIAIIQITAQTPGGAGTITFKVAN